MSCLRQMCSGFLILKIGTTYLYFLYLNEIREIWILVQNSKEASYREVTIFQPSTAFAFSNLALASACYV